MKSETKLLKECQVPAKKSKYYNQKVKLKRFNIGDLILWKVTPATKEQHKASLGRHGKAHTESSTTLDEEAITWKIWIETNCLVHGMLNT